MESDQASKQALRSFEKTVMLYLFESKYQVPASNASPEELEALQYVPKLIFELDYIRMGKDAYISLAQPHEAIGTVHLYMFCVILYRQEVNDMAEGRARAPATPAAATPAKPSTTPAQVPREKTSMTV